ncbi:MAG: type II toxin-antitoxin system VapC family toxin [Actinobacteria bacterium]|nr:type II toxin-antitoxin system VapC family toxin [Actinomycetota bacterium]
MSESIVCDASAVVAVLLDSGPDGQWATERLTGAELYAPTLLPYECANIVRRHELAGTISADQSAQAHTDLLDLPVTLWPYELLAGRGWQLRKSLSIYDAAYVALAESLEAPLVTLDRRLQRSPALRCSVQCPGPSQTDTRPQ